MSNPTYTNQQADFIKEFVGSDSELTIAFNRTFSTDLKKAALRKKRQRLGVARTPEQFRVDRLILLGYDMWEIQASLTSDPPKDIYAEQKEYAAAKRLRGQGLSGPVDA